MDYTTIPPQPKLDSVGNSTASVISNRPWNNGTKQAASLSELLKDAPTYSNKSVGIKTPAEDPQYLLPVDDLIQTTPPMETTTPDVPIMSRGGDTPNSMAVERATEPSLRGSSPTSSIRAPSDSDYIEASPPPPLNFASHHMTPNPRQQFRYNSGESPMAESVATLVPTDSPKSLLELGESPTAVAKGNESGDDYVVLSSESEGTSGAIRSPADVSGKSSGVTSSVPFIPATGKAFLGKGRIDAKAQDDFIAFMLGKK